MLGYVAVPPTVYGYQVCFLYILVHVKGLVNCDHWFAACRLHNHSPAQILARLGVKLILRVAHSVDAHVSPRGVRLTRCSSSLQVMCRNGSTPNHQSPQVGWEVGGGTNLRTCFLGRMVPIQHRIRGHQFTRVMGIAPRHRPFAPS